MKFFLLFIFLLFCATIFLEKNMRIDKFLKVSRIIKRRTVSKDACEKDRILINGKQAKPSKEVKIGDIVEVVYQNSTLKFRVLSVEDNVKKENADKLYEVLND